MRTYILAASLLMVAGPALAGEFWIGKNPKTGDCDIFDVKPDGIEFLIVGDTYASRDEAKDARRKAPECEKNK